MLPLNHQPFQQIKQNNHFINSNHCHPEKSHLNLFNVNCVECKSSYSTSSSLSQLNSSSESSLSESITSSSNCTLNKLSLNSKENHRHSNHHYFHHQKKQLINYYSSSGLIAIITMEIVTIVTLLFVALTFSRSHSLQLTVPNSDQSSIDSNTNSSNFIIDSSSSVPPLYNLPSSSSLSSFTSSSSSSSSMSSSSSSPHNLPFTSGHRVSSSLNPSDGTSNHHHSNVKPIVKLTGKSAFLRREMLKNTSVTCNDGTTAGYYIRHAANGSKKWLIYLEGGGHCFSRESCYQRWIAGRTLMSSAHWPMIRSSKFCILKGTHYFLKKQKAKTFFFLTLIFTSLSSSNLLKTPSLSHLPLNLVLS